MIEVRYNGRRMGMWYCTNVQSLRTCPNLSLRPRRRKYDIRLPFPLPTLIFKLQASSTTSLLLIFHIVIFLLDSYYIPRMDCRHFCLCFFFPFPFFNPRASSFLKVDSSLCSRSQITSPSSIVIHPSLRNNFIYANLSKCRFHCTQVLSYASLSAEEV